MKLVQFGQSRIGVLEGDKVRDVTSLFHLDARWPLPPGDIVIRQLAGLLPQLRKPDPGLPLLDLAGLQLLAPVANPSKIIGAPVNYHPADAVAPADSPVETAPLFPKGLFVKANSSLAGPDTPLRLTFPQRPTNFELELSVVIGVEVRDVPEQDAAAVIAGYTIGLDMTLGGQEQPSYRKSPDGYAIIGPWLVTPDEIADPGNLALSLSVNGELRQSGSTRQLIVNVGQLIAYASRIYTLHPGDILMTGTPAGIGPVAEGDVMRASIEGLGELNVRVVR